MYQMIHPFSFFLFKNTEYLKNWRIIYNFAASK